VEALLPAGVLQSYQVIIDYAHRTFTIAQPGTFKAEGAPVLFRINEKTGLIAIDVGINGEVIRRRSTLARPTPGSGKAPCRNGLRCIQIGSEAQAPSGQAT
jgi:hypothetical protein